MITEYNTEQTALSWFESLGYTIETGINLSPCEPRAKIRVLAKSFIITLDVPWRLVLACPGGYFHSSSS